MASNNSNQYLPGTVQIPSFLLITNITNSYPMKITVEVEATVAANTYQAGQLVKLTVPMPYRMFQANGLVGRIIEVNGSVIDVDIDSTQFDVFVVPSGNVEQPASLAPNGSRNLEFNNTTRQVPFQSLNNRGN